MVMTHTVFKDLAQLREYVKSGRPTLFHSSKTSTVIPFENIAVEVLGDLSHLPKKIEINGNGHLVVSSSICWKEAREFLKGKGWEIMAAPTEELACICAGVATSATGERTFGFGTLREQIVSLTYMNYEGAIKVLKSESFLSDHEIFKDPVSSKLLIEYQKESLNYKSFKNAPFPRLSNETDLMIGTEGQLGLVLEAELKLVKSKSVSFIMIHMPRWEEDYLPHLELLTKIQNLRGKILSCELLDWNSLEHLKQEDRPAKDKDVLFLEVLTEEFEPLYENLLSQMDLLKVEDIFEISAEKFHSIRVLVPRSIYELNAKMKVSKKGTDTQVSPKNFIELLDLYREFTKMGVRYNLFGHFGDHHLHFNFMPKADEENKCILALENFYIKIAEIGGSPFAEHGIGLLKQKFIKNYLKEIHFDMYATLKDKFDPEGAFFPQGYMSMRRNDD